MEYRTPFVVCPLCHGRRRKELGTVDCSAHPLCIPPLPAQVTWVECLECGHVHTADYFTAAGLAILFGKAHEKQVAGGDYDQQRFLWSHVVRQVMDALPDPRKVYAGEMVWLDIGCGNGALVFTAAEFGFKAAAIDARAEAVNAITRLGYEAYQGDFLDLGIEGKLDVVSMADLLEHLPDPHAGLRRAHALLNPGGVVFISCPNMDCVTWKALDAENANPYWREVEHYHNFTRSSLTRLLQQEGFAFVSYAVSPRYKACMQVVARKRS